MLENNAIVQSSATISSFCAQLLTNHYIQPSIVLCAFKIILHSLIYKKTLTLKI